MHSALFWVDPEQQRSDWAEFLRDTNARVKPVEGVLRLSENVWLLNLTISAGELGWLIALAEQRGLSYSILPFERAPEWLPGGSGPKNS